MVQYLFVRAKRIFRDGKGEAQVFHVAAAVGLEEHEVLVQLGVQPLEVVKQMQEVVVSAHEAKEEGCKFWLHLRREAVIWGGEEGCGGGDVAGGEREEGVYSVGIDEEAFPELGFAVRNAEVLRQSKVDRIIKIYPRGWRLWGFIVGMVGGDGILRTAGER